MNRTCSSLLLLVLAAAGCSSAPAPAPAHTATGAAGRAAFVARDTIIAATLEVSGIAAPVREAILGTKLMGSVTEVLVHEGQHVRTSDVLARIDAREVTARAAQADAGIAQAEAMYEVARTHAGRLRALYADSAAPKAQLDDAEAALARADAGRRAARGTASEVESMRAYADIRAPFDGIIVKRFVDPGAFVSPGAPVIAIQDASRLRISVTVSPSDSRGIRTGAHLAARIEDQAATASVEGIVPASTGALYIINALVDNASGRYLTGGTGTLLLPRASRRGILLPESALVREGDLTGVYVRGVGGTRELRWLRVARAVGGRVEVLAGLRDGETVEMPAPPAPEK